MAGFCLPLPVKPPFSQQGTFINSTCSGKPFGLFVCHLGLICSVSEEERSRRGHAPSTGATGVS